MSECPTCECEYWADQILTQLDRIEAKLDQVASVAADAARDAAAAKEAGDAR